MITLLHVSQSLDKVDQDSNLDTWLCQDIGKVRVIMQNFVI